MVFYSNTWRKLPPMIIRLESVIIGIYRNTAINRNSKIYAHKISFTRCTRNLQDWVRNIWLEKQMSRTRKRRANDLIIWLQLIIIFRLLKITFRFSGHGHDLQPIISTTLIFVADNLSFYGSTIEPISWDLQCTHI